MLLRTQEYYLTCIRLFLPNSLLESEVIIDSSSDSEIDDDDEIIEIIPRAPSPKPMEIEPPPPSPKRQKVVESLPIPTIIDHPKDEEEDDAMEESILDDSESLSQIYQDATKELDNSEPIVSTHLDISNKILGSGSFARVYLGFLRRNNREIKVAIKVFLSAATDKMIRNECIIMK